MGSSLLTSYSYFLNKFVTSNAELIERTALFEFQDFFVFSIVKLHCIGDLAKYWVDQIEWLGDAQARSQKI